MNGFRIPILRQNISEMFINQKLTDNFFPVKRHRKNRKGDKYICEQLTCFSLQSCSLLWMALGFSPLQREYIRRRELSYYIFFTLMYFIPSSVPLTSYLIPYPKKGREAKMKRSSIPLILNYKPLFTGKYKNMKAFIKIGLKDTVKMLAYCLSNSVLACFKKLNPILRLPRK